MDALILEETQVKTAISVENLKFIYPGVDDTPGITVFESLDLKVAEGSFVAIVGSNGCG